MTMPISDWLQMGTSGLFAAVLIAVVWIMVRQRRQNNPNNVAKYLVQQFGQISNQHTQALSAIRDEMRNHSTETRELSSAIKEGIHENTATLREMCRFLKEQAEDEKEHRRESREAFRRVEERLPRKS